MSWTSSKEVISLLKKQLGLDDVFFILEKVWGKEIGIECIKITGYKNGTIFTQTQSSVAGYDLVVRRKEIVKKLNQYIGNSKIKNIKVSIR
ncbi:MAG: DUF721 domain-containing protein [Endomicrobium sp.]|jgi:hypothetical protein|nr:DUF721 domain-containing protein [Endomicrobium sp.]